LSPQELWASKKESTFVREDFPAVVVTVLVMRVKGEETLCPYLKCLESGVSTSFLQGAHGPFDTRWSRLAPGAQEAPRSGVIWFAPKLSSF
jgi:hypothetical protein